MWLPSGQHIEVSASVQYLNKIRAILLRERTEFISYAFLNLFDIIIWLQQSLSINLLSFIMCAWQLQRQVPELYAWKPCGNAEASLGRERDWLGKGANPALGEGARRQGNIILISVLLRSKIQLQQMCLRQQPLQKVILWLRVFQWKIVLNFSTQKLLWEGLYCGTHTVLNTVLFLSLILRIKG